MVPPQPLSVGYLGARSLVRGKKIGLSSHPTSAGRDTLEFSRGRLPNLCPGCDSFPLSGQVPGRLRGSQHILWPLFTPTLRGRSLESFILLPFKATHTQN